MSGRKDFLNCWGDGRPSKESGSGQLGEKEILEEQQEMMKFWIGVVMVEVERSRISIALGHGVKLRCNSDVLKMGGEKEGGITDDSQDLILYSWIDGYVFAVV